MKPQMSVTSSNSTLYKLYKMDRNEYTMSEEPIGLVQLPNTFTNTLVNSVFEAVAGYRRRIEVIVALFWTI